MIPHDPNTRGHPVCTTRSRETNCMQIRNLQKDRLGDAIYASGLRIGAQYILQNAGQYIMQGAYADVPVRLAQDAFLAQGPLQKHGAREHITHKAC
eukprot:1159972-Pelagomonas_calceolata.AAC.2